jgi:hypothetical protein
LRQQGVEIPLSEVPAVQPVVDPQVLPPDSPEPEFTPEPREEVVPQPPTGSAHEQAVATPVPDDDHDMLILEYKPGRLAATWTKGRELDPSNFDKNERKQFQQAAKENWE